MARYNNLKRLAFAREYMVDRNATQAAQRLGFRVSSSRRVGCDMLKCPEVLAEIRRREMELDAKVERNLVWVVERLGVEASGELEDSTPNSRVAALDKLMKHLGGYAEDNKQRGDAEGEKMAAAALEFTALVERVSSKS